MSPPISAQVLVAEDNPSVRDFVVRALKGAGHQVTAVSDGLAAVQVLQRERFDVLVTDIAMPGMDGIALSLKAVEDDPRLRVVMISGYAHERLRAHNMDALAHRVIAKPFSLQEICDAVREALALPPAPV